MWLLHMKQADGCQIHARNGRE